MRGVWGVSMSFVFLFVWLGVVERVGYGRRGSESAEIAKLVGDVELECRV